VGAALGYLWLDLAPTRMVERGVLAFLKSILDGTYTRVHPGVGWQARQHFDLAVCMHSWQ